ncbi:MAG: hypothetical protein KatS3mg028_0795 [Bacteroidia bacterium]|nr:MAG: hypothetical protein KatS3mg028_0795 [Bacteroidia bacterium]
MWKSFKAVYDYFDKEKYLKGEVSPVFFGSAVNNFGIQELLDTFVEIAPFPKGRESDKGFIPSDYPKLTGFVFKNTREFGPQTPGQDCVFENSVGQV